MATFSTGERKNRPKGDRFVLHFRDVQLLSCGMCCLLFTVCYYLSDRRSIEATRLIKQTFESAVLVNLFPRSQIDIYVQVLQSDGGTFTDCGCWYL